MSRYISSEQWNTYRKGLQLLDIIIGKMKKENFPISHNASFILELEKMHEGIKNLLYPHDVEDIFWGSFIAGDKDMIAFNYQSDVLIPPMDETEYVFSKTLVLLNAQFNTFYIVTQHTGDMGSIYDFKYFNLKERKAKIFDNVPNAENLDFLFEDSDNISEKVNMEKELNLQLYV